MEFPGFREKGADVVWVKQVHTNSESDGRSRSSDPAGMGPQDGGEAGLQPSKSMTKAHAIGGSIRFPGDNVRHAGISVRMDPRWAVS